MNPALRTKVEDALRTVYDPEIPVNIYELGLVYEIVESAPAAAPGEPGAAVIVKMTLTSPACPSAAEIPADVERKVSVIPGVASAKVEIVWDPPWDPSMMTDAARLMLNL